MAARFSWSRYRSFTDIGTAEGCLAAEIATQHPHLTGTGFDLARVEPLFARTMRERGIAERMSLLRHDRIQMTARTSALDCALDQSIVLSSFFGL